MKLSLTKNTKLWLSTAVLLLLNCFLLYNSWNNKPEGNGQGKASAKPEVKKHMVFSNTKENISIDQSLLSKRDVGLQLLVLLPRKFCPESMSIEMPLLNKLQKKYSKAITILDIGMNYNLDNYTQEDLNVERVHNLKSHIAISKKQVTVPIMMVVDSNGLVQLSHVSDDKNPEKSELFYKRVNSLFSSIY